MTTPDLPPGLIEAVDSAPFGFCLLNRNTGAIVYLNYAFGPMLGNFDIINTNENISKIIPDYMVSYIVNQTQRSFMYDFELPQNGQSSRWIRIHAEEINHKTIPYLALWSNDISNVVESENKNALALKAMEQAAEMKTNLLATMSHEIRTPMQSVFGFLELIAEEKPDEKILDMVGTARSSASDLLEILDDVLDLAKLDADKMELDMFEVPVRTLSYGVIEALEVKKFGNTVDLICDIHKDVPFVIKGDPKRLRQILINLMGNALKFTREGSITLHISNECEHITIPEGQIGLRFEVIDTGIGMTEEGCSRMFKAFSQADNSTTRQFGGTGLGLSICKKLVDLMGGEIGVFSKVNMGSTFWFEIPTVEVDTNQTTVDLPNLDGYAVLVVEDHPKAIIEISNSLKSMGADVSACANYAEGLEMAKRRPYDAAVIDHNLPDGYGLNLIRDINDIRPYCGLVMYTVYDDYSIQNALRSIGATHLLKPASRAGLGEAVKGVVKQISSQKLDGSQKILIAEDTEAVRNILDQQLQKLGINADFVENGRQALNALETGDYGVLFTDLHMPEIDGYQVIKEIRSMEDEDRRFPVIVITADVQMAQRQTYMELGFDECLLKPVSLAQVRRLMMRWGLLPESMPAKNDPEPTLSEEDILPKGTAIDLNELENMLGSLDEMAIEMLDMFVSMTDPLINDLKEAYNAQNWHAFSEIGHSLKGSARSIGAVNLGDICASIQDDTEKADDEKRKKMLEDALIAYNDVKAHIENIKTNGF
jgi:signal transduction histidine kinase/DNA-binding response OmpR family regulator/HPt (histidine-containing phosphotransfer) domain-containing protein